MEIYWNALNEDSDHMDFELALERRISNGDTNDSIISQIFMVIVITF